MATGDRKQSGSKQSRSSRRRRAASRRNEEAEGSAQAQKPQGNGAPGSESQSPPQMANGEKVSSLLETTSQEVKQLLEAADDAAQKIREAAQTDVETEQDSTTPGGEAS